jgi:hypothetical protein
MRRAARLALAALLAAMVVAGCRQAFAPNIPGVRIGHESTPTGPVITAESLSGAPCGPNLPPCPGPTACFVVHGKPTCTTEDAACEAAGCKGRPCQILESFPMRAECR